MCGFFICIVPCYVALSGISWRQCKPTHWCCKQKLARAWIKHTNWPEDIQLVTNQKWLKNVIEMKGVIHMRKRETQPNTAKSSLYKVNLATFPPAAGQGSYLLLASWPSMMAAGRMGIEKGRDWDLEEIGAGMEETHLHELLLPDSFTSSHHKSCFLFGGSVG